MQYYRPNPKLDSSNYIFKLIFYLIKFFKYEIRQEKKNIIFDFNSQFYLAIGDNLI